MGKCPRSKCDLATVHGVGQSMDASRECRWHEVYFVRNDVGRFYGLKDIQMKAGTQGFPLEHCTAAMIFFSPSFRCETRLIE